MRHSQHFPERPTCLWAGILVTPPSPLYPGLLVINLCLSSTNLLPVSSPFFEEPFDIETFEKNMLFRIEIYKPKKATSNTEIEIKIEFDTDNEKFIRETPNLG